MPSCPTMWRQLNPTQDKWRSEIEVLVEVGIKSHRVWRWKGFLLSRSNLARITAKKGESCRTASRRATNSTAPTGMR